MNKSNMVDLIQRLINSKINLTYKYKVTFSENGDLNLWAVDSSKPNEAKVIFSPNAKLLVAFFDKEKDYKFSLDDTYAGETELFNDLILNNVLKLFFAYGSVLIEGMKKESSDKEKMFLVKVFEGDFGYLFYDENEKEYYTGSISSGTQIEEQKCLFTKNEIDRMCPRKDIAVDWTKAELIESSGYDD